MLKRSCCIQRVITAAEPGAKALVVRLRSGRGAGFGVGKVADEIR